MKRLLLMIVTMCGALSGQVWAADATQNGIPDGHFIPEAIRVGTESPVTVEMLGNSYYRQSPEEFAADLNKLLTYCNVIQRIEDEYVVVMFTAKLRCSAEPPTVIHVMFNRDESVTFPGIAAATWVYLTGEEFDVPRTQLLSTRLENPNLALAGPLAATLIPTLPVGPGLRAAGGVYIHVASVRLPFTRSTITGDGFIERPDPTAQKQPAWVEISGSATFNNTPNTWLTINAGVAIISGGIQGDQRIKIDGDRYEVTRCREPQRWPA